MATGYLTFAGDTVGSAPAGLTAMLNTASATWTVQEDGAGGRCLRLAKSGTSDSGMSINAIGDTSDDVEIYARLRATSDNGTQAGVALLMETNTASSASAEAYVAAYQEINNNRIRPARRIATVGSTWGAGQVFTLLVDTWYHFRLQRSGSACSIKVWDDGDTEPAGWTFTQSDAVSTLTTGLVGPFSRDTNGSKEWSFIGWGTGGDAAPTESSEDPPAELGVPAGFTFTASGRVLDGDWTAVAAADSYDWQVERDDGGTWVAFESANTVTTSFQLDETDLVAFATTYRSRVRSATVSTESAWTGWVEATTAADVLDLSGSQIEAVSLSWTAATGPYDIRRNSTDIIATGLTVTTYTDTDVTAGTSYTYEVREDAGAWSEPVTVAVVEGGGGVFFLKRVGSAWTK